MDYAIPGKYFRLQKSEMYPTIYQKILKYRTIIWRASSEMTTQIWLEHGDKAIRGMYVDARRRVSELGGREGGREGGGAAFWCCDLMNCKVSKTKNYLQNASVRNCEYITLFP